MNRRRPPKKPDPVRALLERLRRLLSRPAPRPDPARRPTFDQRMIRKQEDP
jgi:hypothetical protein